MSKVALSGNASGTGTFTIASPNSNVDRTLNLPDASGTVQVSGQPVSATTGTFSGDVTLGTSVLATPSGSAPSYTCRAWVNFNGGGTVAIRASGNVTSITDNGVGDYILNFTTAMPDVNYSYGGVAGVTGGSGRFVSVDDNAATTMLTTAVRISVNSGINTKVDADRVLIQVFR